MTVTLPGPLVIECPECGEPHDPNPLPGRCATCYAILPSV